MPLHQRLLMAAARREAGATFHSRTRGLMAGCSLQSAGPTLTEEGREALDTHDFRMGVPFNSYNFEDNLNRAYSRFRYR